MKPFKEILAEEMHVRIDTLPFYDISIKDMEEAAIKYASQAIDECADLVVNSVEPLGKNKILSVKSKLK